MYLTDKRFYNVQHAHAIVPFLLVLFPSFLMQSFPWGNATDPKIKVYLWQAKEIQLSHIKVLLQSFKIISIIIYIVGDVYLLT